MADLVNYIGKKLKESEIYYYQIVPVIKIPKPQVFKTFFGIYKSTPLFYQMTSQTIVKFKLTRNTKIPFKNQYLDQNKYM